MYVSKYWLYIYVNMLLWLAWSKWSEGGAPFWWNIWSSRAGFGTPRVQPISWYTQIQHYYWTRVSPISHLQCFLLTDKLGNDEEDRVSIVSDLESVLTCYCKTKGLTYEINNGWLEILAPLLDLKFSRAELYNCFCSIVSKYIPK